MTRSPSPATPVLAPEVEKLVVDHMSLVVHIVLGMVGRLPAHVTRDELNSAGYAALVQAAKSYDPTLGHAFPKYASSRIRGAILDELRATDWAPRSVRRRAREIEQTRAMLANTLNRTPTDAEVAQALGVDTAEVAANADDVSRASLIPLSGYSASTLDDIVASTVHTPEQNLMYRERLGYLSDAIEELPDRLKVVVEGYFLNERPMAELAETLGVTESRISQMRAEAVSLLRDALSDALDAHPLPKAVLGSVAARRRDAYVAAVAARSSVAERLDATNRVS